MKNRVFYVFFIFEKSKIGFYLNNDLFGNDFSGGVFKNGVFLVCFFSILRGGV